MADTSLGQVAGYYAAMTAYFNSTRDYHQDPTVSPPNFMEVLPNLEFTQIITESQRLAKGQPSMVSGALIEAASSVFATLREGAIRAKIRSDYFSDAQSSASSDASFYSGQGQVMASYINGQNGMQS